MKLKIPRPNLAQAVVFLGAAMAVEEFGRTGNLVAAIGEGAVFVGLWGLIYALFGDPDLIAAVAEGFARVEQDRKEGDRR